MNYLLIPLAVAIALFTTSCASRKIIVMLDGEVPIAVGDEYFKNVGWLNNVFLGYECDDKDCQSGYLIFRKKDAGK